MNTVRQTLISVLGKNLPQNLIEMLLNEYQDIKTHFALGKYRPDELSGGRYAEILLRILEAIGDPNQAFTSIGTQLNRSKIINSIKSNSNIPDSLRIFLLPCIEILLDVRNRRDVAHIGKEINPNFSDSRLVCQIADWTLTELIRVYSQFSIEEAQNLVDRINQIRVPIVGEYKGFIKVLDAKLTAADKSLVILYHMQPEPQKDMDLCNWLKYKNPTRYKTSVLGELDKQAYIHYDNRGMCFITPLGQQHVENNINLELLI